MNFQAYILSKHPEWVCLQIKAPESKSRTPIHLCCVIDTSGSMESYNKLENVKRSLQFLLDFLGPQDSMSVITFSETARTILSQIAVSPNEKDNIRTRISIIRVESNTNLSAGIIQAHDSLQNNTNNLKQGILLLTDGIANVGLTNPTDILELVRNTIIKFNGTSISSVGYSTDHNIELLQSISIEGGGSYYVVNNLEDVATVFGDILGGLVSCTSQQVRVTLPIGTEVKSRYGTNTVGDKVEIIIGDMPAGSEAAFLAKIPSGTITTLKGYDLVAHNTYEINTNVVITEDAALQINGEAHYIRFEVLTLLEQSRNCVSYLCSPTDVATHIEKINLCIANITEYRKEHEHSLWDVLLEELNICKRTLENRHRVAANTPQIMTQHAGYLGRMRGLPATLSQTANAQIYSDGDPTSPPHLSHTFSNYTQRQISSQLYTTVNSSGRQGVYNTDPTHSHMMDPSAVLNGAISGALYACISPLRNVSRTPTYNLSPALRPINSMLPIYEIPSIPIELLPPQIINGSDASLSTDID